MPIKRENYPPDWEAISLAIRHGRAGNVCEMPGCGAVNHRPHPITGNHVVLTAAHLDHNTMSADWNNIRAMCQRCHFNYDRVDNARKRAQRKAARAHKPATPGGASVPPTRENDNA